MNILLPTTGRGGVIRLALGLAVVLAGPRPAAAQVNSTWTGATGNWTNAALWSAGVPQNGQPNPGDLYNAIVNGGGTITLDANILIQALTFQNGTIAGSNSLTINAPMTWSGGTFAGTSSIFANGGGTIEGTANRFLNGGSLTLGGGTTAWSGGTISIDNGSVLTNAVGSLLTATGNNNVARFSGAGTAAFVNAGTFRKETGTETTSVGANLTFTNSGLVDVVSGTLAFNGGGSNTGGFAVGNGATLQFGGGTFNMTSGAGVTGSGTTAFTGGTVNVTVPFTTAATINGGTANFLTGGSYSLAALTVVGGTLGGDAAVGVTGPLTWSGGTIAGATTTINGGGTIEGTANRFLNGGSLTLGGGTTAWSGGTISIDNGSVLTNAIGSVLTATGNNNVSRFSGAGTAAFVNAGTFRKETGTGTTSIAANVTFTNSGLVDVLSGTLAFNGGGSSTGGFAVGNGATLQFGGGTFNMTSGAGVSGSGTTAFTGGTVNVTVPFTTAATINGGTANFLTGGSYSLASLTIVGGTLGGDAAVGVTGPLTWSGGTFTGATTTVNGGGTIEGTATRFLNGGSLTLGGGTTAWSGGTISIDNGSVLTNAIGSVLTATGNNNVSRFSGAGTAAFVNAGTFRKETGTGTTSVGANVTFTNSGLVDVLSGTLAFNGGGSSTGGFAVGNGATLQFGAGTFNMTSGAGVSGLGTTAFTGGTVNVTVPFTTAATINGGTANFFTGGSYSLAALSIVGGTLGGDAAVGVTGPLTWSGGTFTGATTTVNGGGTIEGTATRFLNGGSLTLGGGTTAWSGGTISIDNGSVLTNAMSSVLTATGNNNVSRFSGAGTAAFVNAGTFRKETGTGTTSVGANLTFTNSGLVEVVSGEFDIANGAAFSNFASNTLTGGAYRVFDNANLDFNNRTINTLAANTTVELRGANSTFAAINPVATADGTFRVLDGRAFTFAGPGLTVGSAGRLTVGGASATLTVPDAVAFSNFAAGTLTAGTYEVLANGALNFGARSIATNSATVILNGASSSFAAIDNFATNAAIGDFQVLGGRAFTLANGFSNAGSITVGAGSTLHLSGATNTGTVDNSGAAVWTGTSNITISGAGAWTNQTGSVFDAQNNQSITNGGGSPSLVNNGTFRKSAGAGTTTVAVPFTNNSGGSVQAQAGTISFTGGGTSTGAFNATSGTNSLDAGTYTFNTGTSITGAGTFRINGAALNVAAPVAASNLTLETGVLTGAGALTVSGPLTWNAGTMSGAGSTVANGGITIGAAAVKSLDGRALTLGGGTGTWSNGQITASNGAVLTINAGATMVATGDNTMANGGGAPAFVNSGTFRKSAGGGATTVAVPFTNNSGGAVDVQTGILNFTAGSAAGGSFAASGGAILEFSSGMHNLNAGSAVTGAGTIRFSGGTTNVAGSYSPTGSTEVTGAVNFNAAASTGTLSVSSGFLSGSGVLTANGLTTWSGGTQNGSGTTFANGGLTIAAAAAKTLDSRTLTHGGGAGTWSAGQITMSNGAAFNIGSGVTFTATGNDTMANGGGVAPTFAVAGTFRKSGGTETTTIGSGIGVSNSGMVDVMSGTLAIPSGLSNTGIVQVAAGAAMTGTITSTGPNAFVRGTGTVGTLVMNDQSTLHPGLSPGILTATGAVTMTSGASYSVELNGTAVGNQYSQLVLSGAGASINLGGSNLITSLGYAPSDTDVLTIITGGTVTGTFANAPAGQEFFVGTFGAQPYWALVTYTGTSVVLGGFTPVPEPTHVLLMSGSIGIAGWWRMRRRQSGVRGQGSEVREELSLP